MASMGMAVECRRSRGGFTFRAVFPPRTLNRPAGSRHFTGTVPSDPPQQRAPADFAADDRFLRALTRKLANDAHLWERGYFGIVERGLPGLQGQYPHEGPSWGHGPGVALEESRPVGADTRAILAKLGGYAEADIDALYAAGAVGTVPAPPLSTPPADTQTRIARGELSRVDERHDGWRALAARAEGGR